MEPEIKGRIIGVKSQMKTFTYFFGVTILQLVLRHSDNLSKTLQKSSLTSFQGKGIANSLSIEQLILNVINGLEYENQLENGPSDYGEEVNHYRLSTQLQILKPKFVDSNEKTISAVINYMKNNIGVQTNFYSEIIVLLKLYLVSPATNAVSERSASLTRGIKIWLRSTMSKEKLNHYMLLSIYIKNLMK